MKFVQFLALFCLTVVFAGCASTDDSAEIQDNTDAGLKATDPSLENQGEGLLMDRYTSGEIPGLHEE